MLSRAMCRGMPTTKRSNMHSSLKPNKLAVWADAASINAEVIQQLPSHAEEVGLTCKVPLTASVRLTV